MWSRLESRRWKSRHNRFHPICWTSRHRFLSSSSQLFLPCGWKPPSKNSRRRLFINHGVSVEKCWETEVFKQCLLEGVMEWMTINLLSFRCSYYPLELIIPAASSQTMRSSVKASTQTQLKSTSRTPAMVMVWSTIAHRSTYPWKDPVAMTAQICDAMNVTAASPTTLALKSSPTTWDALAALQTSSLPLC